MKVGRIAMCSDGLAIYSDVDDRGFILLNGDIDAVLDGEKRDVQRCWMSGIELGLLNCRLREGR